MKTPWWHDHQLMWIENERRFVCYCGYARPDSREPSSPLAALKRDAHEKGKRESA